MIFRACGVPVGIVEGRATIDGAGPDLVIVDVRGDASSGMAASSGCARRTRRRAIFAVARQPIPT